jgi:phosphatidylglycerophosphate synthase
LDLFDGILARLLNQTSSFGVFLDIVADNILRTIVWIAAALASSAASIGSRTLWSDLLPFCCSFIVCLEWATMVSTQVHAAQNSQHWKEAKRSLDYQTLFP